VSSSPVVPVVCAVILDDADRVLRKNFPQSQYYALGLERKTPWWQLW
jgi:hypothetical protein